MATKFRSQRKKVGPTRRMSAGSADTFSTSHHALYYTAEDLEPADRYKTYAWPSFKSIQRQPSMSRPILKKRRRHSDVKHSPMSPSASTKLHAHDEQVQLQQTETDEKDVDCQSTGATTVTATFKNVHSRQVSGDMLMSYNENIDILPAIFQSLTSNLSNSSQASRPPNPETTAPSTPHSDDTSHVDDTNVLHHRAKRLPPPIHVRRADAENHNPNNHHHLHTNISVASTPPPSVHVHHPPPSSSQMPMRQDIPKPSPTPTPSSLSDDDVRGQSWEYIEYETHATIEKHRPQLRRSEMLDNDAIDDEKLHAPPPPPSRAPYHQRPTPHPHMYDEQYARPRISIHNKLNNTPNAAFEESRHSTTQSGSYSSRSPSAIATNTNPDFNITNASKLSKYSSNAVNGYRVGIETQGTRITQTTNTTTYTSPVANHHHNPHHHQNDSHGHDNYGLHSHTHNPRLVQSDSNNIYMLREEAYTQLDEDVYDYLSQCVLLFFAKIADTNTSGAVMPEVLKACFNVIDIALNEQQWMLFVDEITNYRPTKCISLDILRAFILNIQNKQYGAGLRHVRMLIIDGLLSQSASKAHLPPPQTLVKVSKQHSKAAHKSSLSKPESNGMQQQQYVEHEYVSVHSSHHSHASHPRSHPNSHETFDLDYYENEDDDKASKPDTQSSLDSFPTVESRAMRGAGVRQTNKYDLHSGKNRNHRNHHHNHKHASDGTHAPTNVNQMNMAKSHDLVVRRRSHARVQWRPHITDHDENGHNQFDLLLCTLKYAFLSSVLDCYRSNLLTFDRDHFHRYIAKRAQKHALQYLLETYFDFLSKHNQLVSLKRYEQALQRCGITADRNEVLVMSFEQLATSIEHKQYKLYVCKASFVAWMMTSMYNVRQMNYKNYDKHYRRFYKHIEDDLFAILNRDASYHRHHHSDTTAPARQQQPPPQQRTKKSNRDQAGKAKLNRMQYHQSYSPSMSQKHVHQTQYSAFQYSTIITPANQQHVQYYKNSRHGNAKKKSKTKKKSSLN